MVYINENIMFTLQITLQIFFKMGAVNLKNEYYVNQQNDIIFSLLYKFTLQMKPANALFIRDERVFNLKKNL